MTSLDDPPLPVGSAMGFSFREGERRSAIVVKRGH